MKFEKIKNQILGLRIIIPNIYSDDRGYFYESFNSKEVFKNIPPHLIIGNKRYQLKRKFVQDNQSCSKKGVIRGLHMQIAPHEQGKLVRVIKG